MSASASKNPAQRTLLALPMVLGGFAGFAQSTGFRFIFPEFPGIYADGFMRGTFLGFGIDRDFHDRLGVGFDLVWGVGSMGEGVPYYVQAEQGEYTADYFIKPRSFTFTYRTHYSFADNDGYAGYLGSFIGFRRVHDELEIRSVDGPGGHSIFTNHPFDLTIKGGAWLVPIGLRLGVRGGLQGGYADLYTSIAYQIGGGTSIFDEPYLLQEYTTTNTLCFTAGFAYGFGN